VAQPYKTKVLKKLIEFYVDGIEIGDNPIGGGAEEVPEGLFSLYNIKKSQNLLKSEGLKVRKIVKNIKVVTKWSKMGR